MSDYIQQMNSQSFENEKINALSQEKISSWWELVSITVPLKKAFKRRFKTFIKGQKSRSIFLEFSNVKCFM